MTIAFLPISLVAYLVGIGLASIATLYRSPSARRAASFVFVLAWVAHLGAVVHQGLSAGHIPLSNMAEYLLVVGWAIMTLHLYVWFRLRIDVAGLVLPPLSAIAGFAALQLLSAEPGYANAPRGWLLFHTTISTLGIAILGVAFAMSVIYLLQDRALKTQKTLVLLERLPPLDKCDQIGFRALVIGFVLLTVGIGTGVVVNTSFYEKFWQFGAKQTFPVLAWIVFAAIVGTRVILGFRGRRSAYLTIAGFMLVVLTVMGMSA